MSGAQCAMRVSPAVFAPSIILPLRPFAHSPTRPATPTPSATTSATLDPSLPAPAAPLPCVAVALAPAVLVSPDKLAVVSGLVGLISVVVLATEVRLLPTLSVVVEDTDTVMVPVAVGDEVSVDGTVKPGVEMMVRGMETKRASSGLRSRSRLLSLSLLLSRSRGSGPSGPLARSVAVAVGWNGREKKRRRVERRISIFIGDCEVVSSIDKVWMIYLSQSRLWVFIVGGIEVEGVLMPCW